MKKRFYTACTFALLALMTASAQVREANHQVRVTNHQMRVTNHQMRAARHQLKVTNAQEIEAKLNETTAPTAYTHEVGAATMDEGKVEYDQQGRAIRITYANPNMDGSSISIQITYVDNAEGKWTTKTMSTRNNSNEEIDRTKADRTLDSKGRTIAIDYSRYDSKSKHWTLTRSCAFDYDHVINDSDVRHEGDATVTKDIAYKIAEGGYTYEEGYECIWYEPTQEYLVSDMNIYGCWKYQLEGNTLYRTEADYDIDTGKVRTSNIVRKEVQEGIPEAGYYTLTESYKEEDNKPWRILYKTVQTNNFEHPFSQSDNQERSSRVYAYDEDNQQFYFSTKRVDQWVSHPTLKLIKVSFFYDREDQAEPDYIRYYLVDEKGELEKPTGTYICLSDNGDYSILRNNKPSMDITFYTAQGEKTRQLRLTDTRYTLAQAPTIAEELKNGEWVPVRNETLKTGDSGYIQLAFKTNEKGYLTEMVQQSLKSTTTLFRYTDTGYTFDHYLKYEDSDLTYQYQAAICSQLEGGQHEIIYTNYKEDGSLLDNERNVYKDGVCFHYIWNNETNNWSDNPEISVAPIVTVDADGTKTTIERTYSDNQIVNTEKTVTKPYYIPAIKMIVPANPLPEVIPDRFFNDMTFYSDIKGTGTNNYTWNQETNEWEAFFIEISDYAETKDETTGITTHHVTKDGDKYVYSVDSKGRLTAYQDKWDDYRFVYDAEGHLCQVSDYSDAAEVETYTISYGKINVTDGISQAVTAQALRLHVSGKTVTAEGSKSLQLYSLDGKLVGKSQMGSITAPAAGTYVVVADGTKSKIILR